MSHMLWLIIVTSGFFLTVFMVYLCSQVRKETHFSAKKAIRCKKQSNRKSSTTLKYSELQSCFGQRIFKNIVVPFFMNKLCSMFYHLNVTNMYAAHKLQLWKTISCLLYINIFLVGKKIQTRNYPSFTFCMMSISIPIRKWKSIILVTYWYHMCNLTENKWNLSHCIY